jgi:GNAT superfamily N-acetyltransferase
MTEEYVTRNMTRDELDMVVEWAAREGWNPGHGDADAFFAADPEGFFIGELNGTPIASISAVSYSPDFAFVGFYIVNLEHRGNGYGLKLWQNALSQVKAASIGLDGVVAQQDNYRKSGFVLAHRNLRYETVAAAAASHRGTDGITTISEADFDQLLRYDEAIFRAPRAEFLRRWLFRPEGRAVLARRSDEVAGYAAMRPAREGYRVGPLFADEPAIASRLLEALTIAVPAGSRVFIDVPLGNGAAVQLAERLKMTPAFDTA